MGFDLVFFLFLELFLLEIFDIDFLLRLINRIVRGNIRY